MSAVGGDTNERCAATRMEVLRFLFFTAVAMPTDRHIAIPNPLTMPLQVKAAYNDQDIFIRYRWPSPRPGIHHDVLRYQGGKWVVQGEPVPGSEPNGLAEDRLAMMLDDDGVPEFARYGGYITIGDGIEPR